MHFRLQKYSYRFAEQVLNSNLAIKQEIDDVIQAASSNIAVLSRPNFNKVLREQFISKNWEDQP